MPSAWFRLLVHNAAPPSLHGVREGRAESGPSRRPSRGQAKSGPSRGQGQVGVKSAKSGSGLVSCFCASRPTAAVARSGGRLRCGTGPFRAGPAAAGGSGVVRGPWSVVRGQWSVVREDPTDTPPRPTGRLPTLNLAQFDNLAQRTRFPKLVVQ